MQISPIFAGMVTFIDTSFTISHVKREAVKDERTHHDVVDES